MQASHCAHFVKTAIRAAALSVLLMAVMTPAVAAESPEGPQQPGGNGEAALKPATDAPASDEPAKGASVTGRTVVVTATRTEREVFDVPQSVSVVTSRQMERQPRGTIAEQLQDIPGIQVSDGGMGGGAKRVSIRGESPARVLILIDGMKISEQKSMDGSMIMIDPLNVERIEVIKGPASVLYGSEAIGGVVNIITKKGGTRPVQGGFALTYDGSDESLTPFGTLYGTYEGFSYRISGDYTDANNKRGGSGTIDETNYTQRNMSAYLDYSWGTGKIGAGYDHFWSNIHIPGAISGGAQVDLRLPKWQRDRFYAFIEQEQISDYLQKVKLTGYYQKSKKDFWNNISVNQHIAMSGPFYQDISVWQHPYTKNEQKTYGLNLQTDWTLGDHYIIAGVDYLYDDLDASSETTGRVVRQGFLPPGRPVYEVTDNYSYYTYEGNQQTLALFIQDEWTFHPDWTATIGLRQTWVRSELDKTNDPTLREQSNSDSHLVGSLGLVYSGFENWRLRALYSQGYRYPLLNQLYIGTTHGSSGTLHPNADLDPETSHNFEVGARYDANGVAADLGVFYNIAKDYINSRSIAGTDDTIFENVDKAETFGVELTLSYTHEPWGLTPYLSGTFLHRTFDRGGVEGESVRTGDPRWTGRAGLRFEREFTPWLSFHADAYGRFACSAKEYIGGGDDERHAGWGTANLAFGVRLGEEQNYFVDVNLNNIFDKRYTLASSTLEDPGMHAVLRMGVEF